MSGRLLVVAGAVEPGPLRCAVETGARQAALDGRAMTVLAAYGTSKLMRSFAWTCPMPVPETLEDDVRTEVEARVRKMLAAITPEIGCTWYCLPAAPHRALADELARSHYANVVVGCSGTRLSRRRARRLDTIARRAGCATAIARDIEA